MPVVDEQPDEVDEDTLSGLEATPAVDTMVVPPEEAQAYTATPQPEPEPEAPKESLGVRTARLVVALAIVAALALLVYWLLGQSQ
jgi:hypothetical protein